MGCRSCESTIDEPGDKAVEALPRAAAACPAPPDCQPSRPPSAQTETSAATTAAGPFGPGLKNGVQARPATTASPLPLAGPHSRCFVVETREKRPPMQIACCCRQGLGPRAQHGLSPCDRVSTRHPLSPATRVARVVTACTRSTVCLVLDSCPRIQRAAQIPGRRAAVPAARVMANTQACQSRASALVRVAVLGVCEGVIALPGFRGPRTVVWPSGGKSPPSPRSISVSGPRRPSGHALATMPIEQVGWGDSPSAARPHAVPRRSPKCRLTVKIRPRPASPTRPPLPAIAAGSQRL